MKGATTPTRSSSNRAVLGQVQNTIHLDGTSECTPTKASAKKIVGAAAGPARQLPPLPPSNAGKLRHAEEQGGDVSETPSLVGRSDKLGRIDEETEPCSIEKVQMSKEDAALVDRFVQMAENDEPAFFKMLKTGDNQAKEAVSRLMAVFFDPHRKFANFGDYMLLADVFLVMERIVANVETSTSAKKKVTYERAQQLEMFLQEMIQVGVKCCRPYDERLDDLRGLLATVKKSLKFVWRQLRP